MCPHLILTRSKELNIILNISLRQGSALSLPLTNNLTAEFLHRPGVTPDVRDVLLSGSPLEIACLVGRAFSFPGNGKKVSEASEGLLLRGFCCL